MGNIRNCLILTIFILCFQISSAKACPQIGGQVDYNCDQMHKVVVIGDSIVKGIGDLKFGNKGGYVLRLQKKFKKSVFVNYGKPGYSTTRLFSELKSKLNKRNKNSTKLALQEADIVLIDAGRNDFFEENDPGLTVKTLERIVGVLKDYYQSKDQVVPLIKVATLLPTTRAYQRSFIDDVNKLLLEYSSDNLPVRFYYNLLDKSVISSDGIHPYSKGYSKIASYDIKIFKGGLREEALSNRPDEDNDGIYDMFEESKFGTNPKKKDTDGDTLSDGEEVFNLGTDPLVSDLP